jgi:RHS repeat-associated protein
VVSATYGDGIVRTNTYDKMGRPTEIQDGTTTSPTYRLYLTYYGNGTVKTFNDTVSGSYTFTYDAFNRLVSSTNTAQSYSWTYDQFGNRWHQDKTAGTGYTADFSFNNNNRITTSGFSYDAAGNLLRDGSACNPCWQYDDNGNLVSSSYGSSAATYVYDALGRRVEKVSGGITFDFVLDGSNPLDEYPGSVWPTVWSRTTGGVFTYANGTTYFNRTDDIGTPRVSTDYTGTVKRTETMGPFGDGFTESYTGLDFTGFAGGAWDQENNGDHFGAREYAKTQGRWLSPDPAGLAAVDPTNPQTWNRYAYVLNNPVSFTDPTGLVCEPFCDGGSMDDDSGWTGQNFDTGAGCDPTRDSFCIFNPRTPFPRTSGGQSGFSFGFGSSFDGSSLLCGESVGLPCGLPIDTTIWNVLGITAPQMNCMPVCDAANAANNGSYAWTFTKAFFKNFSLSAVYHSFGEGGCDRLMAETFADAFNPLPGNGVGPGDVAEIGPKAVAGAGQAAASAYSVYQGLSVPLRSSIYRGLQSSTYGSAGALEEAAPYAVVVYAGGNALYTAGSAAYNGECH